MTAFRPAGWPDRVPPPDTPGWEEAAVEWLLDLCPPDFRGYPVLRRHPVALAWLAGTQVEASRRGMAGAVGRARAELSEAVTPGALADVLRTLETEQARLLGAARGVHLVEQALRGLRFVPRL